jgi:hypothetical protein
VDLKNKFAEQAARKGGTDYTAPPFRIRGKDLDDNFNQVKPATHVGTGEQKAYRVSESKDGWELIFPWWPPPQGGTWVLASVNGKMTWIPTEECPT